MTYFGVTRSVEDIISKEEALSSGFVGMQAVLLSMSPKTGSNADVCVLPFVSLNKKSTWLSRFASMIYDAEPEEVVSLLWLSGNEAP